MAVLGSSLVQINCLHLKQKNFQLLKHSKFYFQKDSDVFQNLQIIPKSAQVLCHKAFVGFPFENWRDVVHILDAANVIVGWSWR